MTKGRILSGMQPTNDIHIGNYLGAIKNWVHLQHDYDSFYMIADLHAITVPQDPEVLRSKNIETAAAYIASGVDAEKSTIFIQSTVPEHAQLMWLLSTMTQIGKLDRMTQFKEKSGKNSERVGLGLYAYPVLMAADILLYKATHVPVGEDQKQHLELTREVASTFNHRYNQEFFTLPEPVIMPEGARIMSLRDGNSKMSKSAESDLSRINLTDDADTIAQKIKKAKTDTINFMPHNLEECQTRPEVKNLLTIYACLQAKSLEDVVLEWAGTENFSGFKQTLIDALIAHLSPITTKLNHLLADQAYLNKILSENTQKARAVAAPVLSDTMKIMGF